MMTYELIDQTGERFGRNRQWLIVISDGHRKRGFCTVPLWEDFPADQLRADAQHVLRQLQAYDETATIDALRAQNAALVAALKQIYECGSISQVERIAEAAVTAAERIAE